MPQLQPVSALGVVLAYTLIVSAYSGWNAPAYFAEEKTDPAKQIPRALFTSGRRFGARPVAPSRLGKGLDTGARPVAGDIHPHNLLSCSAARSEAGRSAAEPWYDLASDHLRRRESGVPRKGERRSAARFSPRPFV